MLCQCYSLCYSPLTEQFLRGAVICNKTPAHWIRSVFSARLKQSKVLTLVACVANGSKAKGWAQPMIAGQICPLRCTGHTGVSDILSSEGQCVAKLTLGYPPSVNGPSLLLLPVVGAICPNTVMSAPYMSVFRGLPKAFLFRRSFPWLFNIMWRQITQICSKANATYRGRLDLMLVSWAEDFQIQHSEMSIYWRV